LYVNVHYRTKSWITSPSIWQLFKWNSIGFHWSHRDCSTKKKKKDETVDIFIIIMCKHRKRSQILHIWTFCVIIACITADRCHLLQPSKLKDVSRNSWTILDEVLSMRQKLFVCLHDFCFWNSDALIKACHDRTAQCVWNSWLCVSTAF